MNDYLELPLYFNEEEDPKTVELWVYTEPNKFFVIHGVTSDPIRYQGWWSIPFVQYNRHSTAHIEDSKLMYFVTIDNKDKP
jgi:hypothetical protein